MVTAVGEAVADHPFPAACTAPLYRSAEMAPERYHGCVTLTRVASHQLITRLRRLLPRTRPHQPPPNAHTLPAPHARQDRPDCRAGVVQIDSQARSPARRKPRGVAVRCRPVAQSATGKSVSILITAIRTAPRDARTLWRTSRLRRLNAHRRGMSTQSKNAEERPQELEYGEAPMRPLLLTVPEAAAVLSVGRTTLYELIGAGEIAVVHIGRSCRVPAAAICEFVAAKHAARMSKYRRRRAWCASSLCDLPLTLGHGGKTWLR